MTPGRGQGGFTLVELLLALVVSALVATPLAMWMVMGYRTHDQVTKRSHDDDAAVFLATALQRDVLGADVAARGGAGCPPAAGSTLPADAESILVLTKHDLYDADDDPGQLTTYAVAEVPSATGEVTGTLIRRVCTNEPPVTSQERVLADRLERPLDGWSRMVVCEGRGPDGAEHAAYGASDQCGRVTITFIGRSGTPASVTAARRTTATTSTVGGGGG